MKLRDLRGHAVQLGFTPQGEVRWLSPQELWRTAVKVGLSSVFADYADRREVQAALPSACISIPEDAMGGVWVDFVADVGDGFDSTYTVASLLAASELTVDPPPVADAPAGSASASDAAERSRPLVLPRGRLLVLGGDEVYPTPSAIGYEDRMKGPYRAALPDGSAGTGAERPVMVALPGNHDWYDGLTAFLRVFTQRRPIGAWRTEQTRSYFAVQLPHRWWLVGVDTQLGTYIDDPQVRYFREHLSAQLRPGDGVIVCSPTPTWVHTGEGDPDAFNSMMFFERDVVRHRMREDGSWEETGATVRLWITGDRHHYGRYAEERPPTDPPGAARQLVTCGLGGAYLLDTHRLPTRLELPPRQSRMTTTGPPAGFRLASRWPSTLRSRMLAAGLFAGPPRGLAYRNPGLWPLAGAVQAVLVLVFASVLGQEHRMNPVAVLRTLSAADVLGLAWQATVWLAVALLIRALVPLLRLHRPRGPSEWMLAALLQLVIAFAGLLGVVSVPWPTVIPDWGVLGLALLATAVVAGLAACYGLAAYIALARSRLVRGWQFSAQAIEDYKGFARIRIDATGQLTLYPIVLDAVCRDWELVPSEVPGQPRPVPATGLPRPYLAEPPIVIARQGPRG